MRNLLAATAAVLALTGCAGPYGYAYDYDPYLGVRGHHTGPFERHGGRSGLACGNVVYSGPYDGGWRGPYYAGPYCAPDAGQAAADASARR